MNSRHRRLITGAQPFCTLVIVTISASCVHTEYKEQPIFTLHAVDIDNFGMGDTVVRVDAVCVEQGQKLRCADDLTMAVDDETLAQRRPLVSGPPDAVGRSAHAHTFAQRFRMPLRLIFNGGVPIFAGDTLHVYILESGNPFLFGQYAIYVVDDLGLRWYLYGSDRTIACELHLESPPRPEL